MIGIPESMSSLVERAQGVTSKAEPKEKQPTKVQKAMESSKEWQDFVDSAIMFKRQKTEMETILLDKNCKNTVELLKTVVGNKVTAKDVLSGIVRAFAEQNKDIINSVLSQRQIR